MEVFSVYIFFLICVHRDRLHNIRIVCDFRCRSLHDDFTGFHYIGIIGNAKCLSCILFYQKYGSSCFIDFLNNIKYFLNKQWSQPPWMVHREEAFPVWPSWHGQWPASAVHRLKVCRHTDSGILSVLENIQIYASCP